MLAWVDGPRAAASELAAGMWCRHQHGPVYQIALSTLNRSTAVFEMMHVVEKQHVVGVTHHFQNLEIPDNQPPIMMRNRLWSESSCYDWPACCGGYDGQRPSKLDFSKSRRSISATLERCAKSPRPRVRSFMRCSTQARIAKPGRQVSRS